MKSFRNILAIASFFFLCTIIKAQNGEFKTEEGIKWGMPMSEVKKLKIEAPLSTQQDLIFYHDFRKGDERYNFQSDKLVEITYMRTLYSKKEVNNYFEDLKKELINQYGKSYAELTSNLIEWSVNQTKISLNRSVSKNGGIVTTTYSKL